MADYQRKQLEIKANEEFAAAQREASYEKRKKDLLLSTARARAGGSGFDPKSSDYLRNEEDIASAGDYHRAMLLYGGASRQQGLREQGVLTGMEANSLRQAAGSYRTAGLIGGLGNAFSGISTMARYRQ